MITSGPIRVISLVLVSESSGRPLDTWSAIKSLYRYSGIQCRAGLPPSMVLIHTNLTRLTNDNLVF